MVILNFWKKRKLRLSLNESILRLKRDFQEEIRNFEHFKQLQAKKIEILRKIKEIWNKKWKEAEELVKTHIPHLIKKQLEFVERDIQFAEEEDYVLQHLLRIEERRNSIVGSHISQHVSQEHLDVLRTARNPDLIIQLREALGENSRVLREELFLKLNDNLNKQLQFFQRVNAWQAINENEVFIEYLNEEQILTQRIEHVLNDVIIKIYDILGLEVGRVKEEQRLQQIALLKRKKVHVTSIECELSLDDIEKIVKGEFPLFYYHGTPLSSMDFIFEEKCLIPNKRLELLKKVKGLKRDKPDNWKQKAKDLIAQYGFEYKREIDFFKKLVILYEENKRVADELLSKVYPLDYHPQIDPRKPFLVGNPFPLQLLNIISQIKEFIKKRLELMADGKEIPPYISKKIRELKNKAKPYIISIYIRIKNLDQDMPKQSGIDSSEQWKNLYTRLAHSREFQEYFDVFFRYMEARLIIQIQDESLILPLDIRAQDRRVKYVSKLNFYAVRDKYFIFFGAESPFRATTNFRDCTAYGTPFFAIGVITGIVFEFKPTLKSFIEWQEVQLGGSREIVPPAIYGKIAYDVIAKKKINFSQLIRIYTADKDIEFVRQKMREHGINVPLYDFSKQSYFFQEAINEMKQILINHGLRTN